MRYRSTGQQGQQKTQSSAARRCCGIARDPWIQHIKLRTAGNPLFSCKRFQGSQKSYCSKGIPGYNLVVPTEDWWQSQCFVMADMLGTSGLPASIWHVGLGWLEIASELGSIVSTIMIVGVVRGLGTQLWFFAFLFFQIVFFLGIQVFHMVIAAMEASKSIEKGHPGRCRAVCWALWQGAANREFFMGVYQEYMRKHVLPRHTSSALDDQITELVWVPLGCRLAQVLIIDGTIMIMRVAYDNDMLVLQCDATLVSNWARTLQVYTLGIGLISLLFRLFLGLTDVQKTYGVSLATGLCACVKAVVRSHVDWYSHAKVFYLIGINLWILIFGSSVPRAWLLVIIIVGNIAFGIM